MECGHGLAVGIAKGSVRLFEEGSEDGAAAVQHGCWAIGRLLWSVVGVVAKHSGHAEYASVFITAYSSRLVADVAT